MPFPLTVIDYRRAFRFAVSPEEMWGALSDPRRFASWWGWLSEFAVDGDGLADGVVLSGVVAPPVPYRMRVTVHLEKCVAPRHIDATVDGDLRGPARLTLEADGEGTRAEVSWTVDMKQLAMRMACRVAHPLFRWGHDRVVEMTLRGLPDEFGYLGPAPAHRP